MVTYYKNNVVKIHILIERIFHGTRTRKVYWLFNESYNYAINYYMDRVFLCKFVSLVEIIKETEFK